MPHSMNPVKLQTSRARYEFLRDKGILLYTGVGDQVSLVKGEQLDFYIDHNIYKEQKKVDERVAGNAGEDNYGLPA